MVRKDTEKSLSVREMKIQTRRTSHFTPARKAIIKKTDNNKYWRGCGKTGTLGQCWWGCKMVQLLWKTVW